jgi:hypothetical protein
MATHQRWPFFFVLVSVSLFVLFFRLERDPFAGSESALVLVDE